MRSDTCAICAVGLTLCARRLDLLRVRLDLTVLRGHLIALRLDLLLEDACLALRLIELLGGGRLLRIEALAALVVAPRDLELRVERRALRSCGVALRGRCCSLRLEHVDLLRDLVDPRGVDRKS